MVQSTPQTNMQMYIIGQSLFLSNCHPCVCSYLINSVLVHGLLLVQTGQSSVVALVQSPGLGDGNPQLVRLLESEEKSLDGTLQAGGVGSVELQTLGLDELTTVSGLLHSLVGERNIVPAGEAVLLVPLGFSVANKDQSVEGLGSGSHTSGGSRHQNLGGRKHEEKEMCGGREGNGRGGFR